MEITKISTHSRRNERGEEVSLYAVVTGKGSTKTSQGRHLSDSQVKTLRQGN